MSLIISPLQKLIKNEENNERLKIYHIIYRNAERILNLVNQLMDIRKIDKGQMFLMFRETNIIPLLRIYVQLSVNRQIQKISGYNFTVRSGN